MLKFGSFQFDLRRGLLRRDAKEIVLGAQAQALLRCLLERPGTVVTKEELVERAWASAAITDHAVTEAIRGLRKVLDDDPQNPRYIQTVHRQGYRFIAQVSHVAELQDERALGASRPATTEGPAVGGSDRWRPLLWGLTAIAVGLVGVAWLASSWPATPEGDTPHRFPVLLEEDQLLAKTDRLALAMSPDGQTLVHTRCPQRGACRFFFRRSDQELMERIQDGPSGVTLAAPFFSPAGDWLGYWGSSGLSKFDMTGDLGFVPITDRTDLPSARFMGATWTDDDTIVFALAGREGGLWSVPGAGGVLEPGPANQSGVAYVWPERLPGQSNHVLVGLKSLAGTDTDVGVVDLETGEPQVLVPDAMFPKYVESGHLLFVREGRSFAVRFDSQSLEVSGEETPLGIRPHVTEDAAAQLAVSASGRALVYAESPGPDTNRLVWVDREGDAQFIKTGLIDPRTASVSPDGTFIAVTGPGTSLDAAEDLWTIDPLRPGSHDRYTTDERNLLPVWSPSGDVVVYGHLAVDGGMVVVSMNLSDRSKTTLLADAARNLVPMSWSSDRRFLIYGKGGADRDLWVQPMSGSAEAHALLATPAVEGGATFSPDGKWFAYHSDEAHPREVYVRPFPADLEQHDPSGAGAKVKISEGCGSSPVWSADGSEIYFWCGLVIDGVSRAGLYSVSVRVDPATMTVEADPPRLIYRTPTRIYRSPTDTVLSVHPDGGVLLIEEDERPVIRELHWMTGFLR